VSSPGGVPADLVVVEDDEDLASLVEMFLIDRGHTVRTARNGEQGLALLNEHLPDVVIMDVEMPILTGPEMATRMFATNLGQENVPIVIVSGSEGLAAIAARVGTPYYLMKPFSPGAYLDLVERALQERALPRPPLAPT
jgi:DNA-binding response OmpR family regulator